ncbi:MAG: hypothetical protein AB7P35_17185 [Hyphomonadaceae bacterium]
MATTLESGLRSRRNGDARGLLKSRAHDVADDIAELRKDMSKLTDAAKKAARAEFKHAGKRMQIVGADLRGRAEHGVESASERVRARPLAAVGVSLGVGLLLGALLGRR